MSKNLKLEFCSDDLIDSNQDENNKKRIITKVETELDKRQYFPGYHLKWTCDKCNCENDHDFGGGWYLSYPVTNTDIRHVLYCRNCGDENEEVLLRVNMSLELVKK